MWYLLKIPPFFLLFKQIFHNIKSQDIIFTFILSLCNNKTRPDLEHFLTIASVICSNYGLHFLLNLNSKIFDWKLYANFEILLRFFLNLTWLSRGKNSLNFQILLWEKQFSPLKIEMTYIVMTYWCHAKFMFENKHVMFSGKSQSKHLQLLHSYKQFLLIIMWSALHPDQVKYWY